MFLAILVIAMILSAFFTMMRVEDQEESINQQVLQEVEQKNFEDPDEANEYRKERLQKLRKENDLDEPMGKKVLDNAVDMITLDFGETDRYTTPDERGSQKVSAIIMHYLPRTIVLFTTAAVIYTLLAITLSLKTAQIAGSKTDRIVTLIGATFSSVPVWWAGMIFLVIFTGKLGWYPIPSPTFPSIAKVGYLGYLKEFLFKMSLPLFTAVLVKFGSSLWTSRNIVASVLEDDYIMAARAKGVPENKVIYGHALKTAAPPIMTSGVLALLTSLGAFLIAEIVFQWPGIGFMLWRAVYESGPSIGGSGFPFEDRLIAATTFVLVVISIVGLYITDIIYGLLDPRIEVGSKFSKGDI
ncbi:MAG: ABC transporter permease [Candidatus Thermoplasmatota archaeon]